MTQPTPFYVPIHKEVEIFEHAAKNKLPILLKGPTGTGKSRFVEFMAHTLKRKLITISCHEETSSTDLIGRFIIKGAETLWLDGPLTTAAKQGSIIYLDEVAEARPDELWRFIHLLITGANCLSTSLEKHSKPMMILCLLLPLTRVTNAGIKN